MISSLVSERLAGRGGDPWAALDVVDAVGSTNAELLRDPRPWRVLTTDHQQDGRGRLTRPWQTPAGVAIAVSACVPVPEARMESLGWLPLLAGLAIRSAIQRAGVDAVLKWPNDVLAPVDGERKLCGILCELAPGPAPGVALAVLGVGVNVHQTRDQLPVDTATSLALCGAVDPSREVILADFLAEVATRHRQWIAGGDQLAALVDDYRAVCATIGREVDIHLPDGGLVHGVVDAVDDDGRLVLTSAGGRTVYSAGDVVHARLRPA